MCTGAGPAVHSLRNQKKHKACRTQRGRHESACRELEETTPLALGDTLACLPTPSLKYRLAAPLLRAGPAPRCANCTPVAGFQRQQCGCLRNSGVMQVRQRGGNQEWLPLDTRCGKIRTAHPREGWGLKRVSFGCRDRGFLEATPEGRKVRRPPGSGRGHWHFGKVLLTIVNPAR